MKVLIYFIFFVSFVLGCKEIRKDKSLLSDALFCEKRDSYPFIFNTETEYSIKEYRLEDIADISYIPLETPEGKVLGNVRLVNRFLTEDDIFLGDGQIFRFDKTGRFLNTIGKIGRGPGEYTFLHNFCLDENKRQVYILAGFERKMIVCDYDGNFIREFRINNMSSPLLFDSLSLLVRKSVEPYNDIFLSISPFQRVSLKDGHVLDTFVAARKENPILPGTKSVFSTFKDILRFRDDFVLTYYTEDTIFTLSKEGNLSPRYIKEPSNEFLGTSRWFYEFCLETDYFACFKLFRMKTEKEAESKYLMVNKDTREVCRPTFSVANYFDNSGRNRVGLYLYDVGYPNVTVMTIDAYILIECFKQGELDGELKEIASGLTEDSNPVLMMIKFKDKPL